MVSLRCLLLALLLTPITGDAEMRCNSDCLNAAMGCMGSQSCTDSFDDCLKRCKSLYGVKSAATNMSNSTATKSSATVLP
mmetsp:Transcript_1740/g.1875  ORF Transcript_1740/g.1875 Transcript_1740/m.1875 type:complete len:80 (-) Transcript_1740:126-365(-)|eukprot:Skav222074  [mRNA]  locus=scaffold4586:32452:32691:- [translate_table: standard]